MENVNKLDLTVAILTKNEAKTISRCLTAVFKLNPLYVMVIDDCSDDNTQIIARKMGALVINYAKKNFADSRNYALAKSKTSYLLYVDADEILSDQLIEEIKNTIKDFKYDAYKLTRVNYYFKTRWPYEEKIIRLFKVNKLTKWFGEVHESPVINGSVGLINSPLYHYTHNNLSEMIENTLVWSKIEAKLRYDVHHPKIVWWRIFRVMLTAFWDYYFKQGGWKIGSIGLIESIYQSFSIFITYARLWEMQNKFNDD